MSKLMNMKMIYFLMAVALVIVLFLFYKKLGKQEKVSEFGKYQGYF